MSSGAELAVLDDCEAVGVLLGPPEDPDGSAIETSSEDCSLVSSTGFRAARAAADTTRLPDAVV